MMLCTTTNHEHIMTRDFFLVFFGSLLISLCSFIRIPLVFTPVPLVIQNMAAVAIGVQLGPKKGVLSVLLFLAYGCCSVPVFSGGNSGLTYLMRSPTTGYLIGYSVAAYVTGKILESNPSSHSSAILAGFFIVLFFGTAFLAMTMDWEKAFMLGFMPFIAPDILKAAFLIKLYRTKLTCFGIAA